MLILLNKYFGYYKEKGYLILSLNLSDHKPTGNNIIQTSLSTHFWLSRTIVSKGVASVVLWSTLLDFYSLFSCFAVNKASFIAIYKHTVGGEVNMNIFVSQSWVKYVVSKVF